MSKAFETLIAGMAKGEPIRLSGRAPVLTAAELRSALLGDGAPAALGAHVTLVGATIRGRLNLDETAQAGGAAHPALTLIDCRLEGGISLRHAHIRRLVFQDCVFTDPPEDEASFDISGCEIEGDLEIVACKAAEADHPFWIEARGARIDGSVRVCDTLLRAPPPRPASAGIDYPRFALGLVRAEIQGDLNLSPRFVAHGGLGLRGANIQGALRGYGCRIGMGEFYALDARGAQISGDVILTAYDDADRNLVKCNILGPSTLDGARFAGSVFLNGASLGYFRDIANASGDGEPALSLANAHVKGDLVLGVMFGEKASDRVTVNGSINAYSLRVDGYFLLDGASLLKAKDSSRPSYINLNNARIGAALTWQPVVDLAKRIAAYPICDGTIHMNDAHVGSLSLDNIHFRLPMPGGGRMVGVGLKCDGNFWLASRGSGNIDLTRMTVGGELNLSRFVFDAGDAAARVARSPQLRLRDVSVAHAILIAPQRRTVQRLIAVRERKLDFYGGARLVEALWRSESTQERREFQSGHLVMPDGTIHTLDGRSHVFHQLNGRFRADYRDREETERYVRLFFAYVWGEDGAFLIRPEAGQEEPDLVLAWEGDRWRGTVTIDYGVARFRSQIEVLSGGMIEMKSDEPLTPDWAVLPPRFEPPLIYSWNANGEWPRQAPLADMTPASPADWERRLLPHARPSARLAGGWVDLTDASCATLNDDGGRAWGGEVRLMLDRFVYDQQVSHSPDRDEAAVQSLVAARKHWLDLQLPPDARLASLRFKPNNAGDFSIQSLAQLITVLRRGGEEHAAIQFEIMKRDAEGWLAACASSRWLRPIRRAGNWLSRFTMGHLLNPVRATATVVALIGLGTAAVLGAEARGALALDTTPIASLYVPGSPAATAMPIAADAPVQRDIQCGSAINPLLYAADVFIPLIDLRQESQCSINISANDGEGLLWAFGKALYAILGWLVISLTIITFTNVAKRRGEQGG